MKFPRFQIVHFEAVSGHLADSIPKNIDLIDKNYHSKIPNQDISTPTLSEFLILNNATLIIQNLPVSRLFAKMVHYLNLTDINEKKVLPNQR